MDAVVNSEGSAGPALVPAPDSAERIREALLAARFTPDGLLELLGASAYAALARNETVPARRALRTDGPLQAEWFNPSTAALLDAQVWGQGFEPPLFCDEVQVLQQRLVGDKHLKLRVRHAGAVRDAIWFGRAEPVAEQLRLAYRLSLDEWQGQPRVQMVVEAAG